MCNLASIVSTALLIEAKHDEAHPGILMCCACNFAWLDEEAAEPLGTGAPSLGARDAR